MIPSPTEPITKLLNRDRSPFSKQTDLSSPSGFRVNFETFIFWVCLYVSDSLLGSFQAGSGCYNREHVDGVFY